MPSTYKPNGVVSSLHEQKRRYQPNMLMAIGISLLLSGLAGVYISSLPGPDRAFTERSVLTFGAVLHGSGDDETKGNRSATEPVDFRPARYQQHDGFGGFSGYRLVRSGPDAVRTPWESVDLTPDQPTPLCTDQVTGPFALASDSDDCYDDGLPRSPSLLDIKSPLARSRHLRDLLSGHRDTQIDLGERDCPPVLKLQPVRYPKKGWHVNGVVRMVLVVDAKGNIRECQIVNEDPEGHGFAQALKDALNESSFFPPRVNGEELGVRYEFTYEFCWECPRKPEITVTKGDLIVSPYGGR